MHALHAAAVVFLALERRPDCAAAGVESRLSRAGLSVEDAGFFPRVTDLISLMVPANGVQHEQFTYFGLPVLLLAEFALLLRLHAAASLWLAAILVIVLYALGTSGLLWPLLVRLFPLGVRKRACAHSA
ncbi:MAG: hypothetical protein U0694_26995 [Anaerolineae bacterium]